MSGKGCVAICGGGPETTPAILFRGSDELLGFGCGLDNCLFKVGWSDNACDGTCCCGGC